MSTLFGGNVYAGLAGIDLVNDSFDLGSGILLRKVYAHLFSPFMMAFEPAPTGKHHPGPWKSASGGFSFDVNAELFIPENIETEFGSKIGVARTLVFLFRLGVNPAITLPVFSNHSFDTLAEIPDSDARLFPYEVQNRHFPLGVAGGKVDDGAVQWVSERWSKTHGLIENSPEFALAAQAIDSGQFVENHALTLVSLWGALEALFSPSTSELKFRVSALIASFLEEAGENRAQRQKAVASLYDKRSAAAHGKPKHKPEHLLETFNLLREVLFRIIERGSVPKKEELEGMLFGGHK
ncbi:HEPN domain-containing protein [Zobellella denitrificans]|uniref:HEPN domain-containing protein n=1 Tax=Zobellella denitrificans TaxID=347534 RepID=UPI00115F7759|nr:HEPN domain-containing protein [Zobellella denitrificans]